MEPSIPFPTLGDFWTTTTSAILPNDPTTSLSNIWNATEDVLNSTFYTTDATSSLTPIWNVTEDVLNSTFYLTDPTTSLTGIWNATEDVQNATEAAPVSSVARHYPIIVLAMVLSIVALSFSIAVYATLAEFRNVHGRNLICMSGCLLTTYVLLSADLAVRGRMPKAMCFAVGMIIQVTFLGTFFWTNVMAFDIWRSLTAMRARRSSGSGRFRRYAAYAWTATVVTSLPAALLELTEWVPYRYRPQFGVKRCWLSGIFAFLHYFNMPVGFILLSNLVLFVLTLRKLWIIKKTTAILNVKQQQKRFRLYTKLFLVMGITWTSEYLPWMTGKYSLYAIAGMLTALHGCFLFFIFVCKKRILRQFYDTVIKKKELSPSQYNTSTQQTSSSSDSNKKNIDLSVMKV